MAQLVKNPSVMWETWIRSLGWEDALEKGMATYSSILAWRIGVAKNRTRLNIFHFNFYGKCRGFPGGSVGKESACSAGDLPAAQEMWV